MAYQSRSVKVAMITQLFYALILFVHVVENHVCILTQRPDPNRDGSLRWSLPYAEICRCQRVVAPKVMSTCPRRSEEEEDLWFTDDPKPLTRSSNWRKEVLDALLDRALYCTPCPADQELLTDLGKATLFIVYQTAFEAALFGEGEFRLDCDPPSGSEFAIGVTGVQCVARDNNGVTKTCDFQVVVKSPDNEAPVFASCPANQTVDSDLGKPTAIIQWVHPDATDNSGDTPTVICTPSSGSEFRIGQTDVTCVAYDGYGNSAECLFYIRVNDNENPELESCPANQSKNTDPGKPTSLAEWDLSLATDNSGVAPIVTCDPASGSNFPIGETDVTCEAVDTSGNSYECSFFIDVEDNEAPILDTCPANQSKNTDPGKPTSLAEWDLPISTDNSGATPIITCNPASGSHFPIGQTEVICEAVDTSGNSYECSFVIDVKDDEPPVFTTCPTEQVSNTLFGESIRAFQYSHPVATDNAGDSPTVTCNPPSGSVFAIGQTEIACNVFDGYGNSNSCSFLINMYAPQPLGLKDGRILDAQITASSYFASNGRYPYNARLDNSNYWASLEEGLAGDHWLQVDLLDIVAFTGVQTQGSGEEWDGYITQLYIKTGADEASLVPIMDLGVEKIFDASTERYNVATIDFPAFILARILRVYPTAWFRWPVMRMEVLGFYPA